MEGLLSLLFYAIFFYFLMRFGCGSHMVHGHHSEADKKSNDAVFMDPVCGKVVADNEGYGELVDGKLFRFCSKSCLDEFDHNIEQLSQKPNKFAVKKEHKNEA
ncbi:YHS domain-containing protein [Colwellia ponticola]|uniref:YHS domain-containing protein n=1 Tax=Colwellia ponticola TaxID=2304625 RepID=A0A8H2PKQ5_9GAMM|nr:YHS domain-containing protein [Colwellia ponticola]TMM42401.1 YHS domain-containing protein [Colwellia ponticola]